MDKLVVGNKSDEVEKRSVSYDEGYEFAKDHNLHFTEVSALNAANIAEAFELIAKKIMKRLDSIPMPLQRNPQKLDQKNTNNKNKNNGGGGGGGCCWMLLAQTGSILREKGVVMR